MSEVKNKLIPSKFVEGSIFKHVAVMSSASAVGLLAVFLVDLVDLFFLSLLGQEEIAAAVGFAGTILFFTICFSIGLFIATSSLVGRAIGEGEEEKARRLTVNGMTLGVLSCFVVSALLLLKLPEILLLLGAEGQTKSLAEDYLYIILPSMPLMNIGMQTAAILRCLGDAKRSMRNNVFASFINAILDPMFIFAFAWDLEGAALASVSARLTMALVGCWDVFFHHQMTIPFCWRAFREDFSPLCKIAIPAVLTNTATSLGAAYVTASLAPFGVSVMAGNAIVTRLTPVAFALFFSLSGAVGPIIAQNYGAKRFDRIRETLTASMKFLAGYTFAIWGLFLLGEDLIIRAFDTSDEAVPFVEFFVELLVPLAYFLGLLFLSNATFNNLGRAFWATIANFGRATLGTVPFVYLGARWYGANGVLLGQSIGTAFIAILTTLCCFWLVKHLEQESLGPTPKEAPAGIKYGFFRTPLWPFSYSRAITTPVGEELEGILESETSETEEAKKLVQGGTFRK